jgi:hypothetical protein
MKNTIFILLLLTTSFCANGQELTFDKQLEQALTDVRRSGTTILQTHVLADPSTPVGQDALNAIADVMSVKDGYIRLIRKSDTELTVIHADYVTTGDLLSVFRFAGVECIAHTSTPSAKTIFGE